MSDDITPTLRQQLVDVMAETHEAYWDDHHWNDPGPPKGDWRAIADAVLAVSEIRSALAIKAALDDEDVAWDEDYADPWQTGYAKGHNALVDDLRAAGEVTP